MLEGLGIAVQVCTLALEGEHVAANESTDSIWKPLPDSTHYKGASRARTTDSRLGTGMPLY